MAETKYPNTLVSSREDGKLIYSSNVYDDTMKLSSSLQTIKEQVNNVAYLGTGDTGKTTKNLITNLDTEDKVTELLELSSGQLHKLNPVLGTLVTLGSSINCANLANNTNKIDFDKVSYLSDNKESIKNLVDAKTDLLALSSKTYNILALATLPISSNLEKLGNTRVTNKVLEMVSSVETKNYWCSDAYNNTNNADINISKVEFTNIQYPDNGLLQSISIEIGTGDCSGEYIKVFVKQNNIALGTSINYVISTNNSYNKDKTKTYTWLFNDLKLSTSFSDVLELNFKSVTAEQVDKGLAKFNANILSTNTYNNTKITYFDTSTSNNIIGIAINDAPTAMKNIYLTCFALATNVSNNNYFI